MNQQWHTSSQGRQIFFFLKCVIDNIVVSWNTKKFSVMLPRIRKLFLLVLVRSCFKRWYGMGHMLNSQATQVLQIGKLWKKFWWPAKLYQEKRYVEQQIFNADEKSLFYKNSTEEFYSANGISVDKTLWLETLKNLILYFLRRNGSV